MEDPDEYMLRKAQERSDPMRVPDALEKIEWRLMYGEFGTPLGVKVLGVAAVALLALILWRVW